MVRNGHFRACMRRYQGYERLKAHWQVYGDPSNRAALTWMQHHARPDGATLGHVWGSVNDEIVGWTVASADVTARLADALMLAADEDRYPVVEAWAACVRLTTPAIKARCAYQARPYRPGEWDEEREAALAALSTVSDALPPMMPWLSPGALDKYVVGR